MAAISSVLARLTGWRRPLRSAEGSFDATLARSVVDDLSARLGVSCGLLDAHATRTGSLTLRIRGDRFYIAKVPLRATTEPRLRHNARVLKSFGEMGWVTPFLAARCPEFVLLGTAAGHFYTVETTVPGRDGASILKSGGYADELILSAERYISKLQKASSGAGAPGRARCEAAFEAAARRVAGLAKRAGSQRAYDQLLRAITNLLSAQPVPSVYSHGNFWLGNLLFDTANTLTGVIDWDCAAEHSLPAIDLIYLLVRTHSLARATSFGETLADWLDAESLPFLDGCIARHCDELSIPAELIVPLSYGCWIQHLDAHCRYGTSTGTRPEWLHRNVRQVVERWRPDATAGKDRTRRWHLAG